MTREEAKAQAVANGADPHGFDGFADALERYAWCVLALVHAAPEDTANVESQLKEAKRAVCYLAGFRYNAE